jgi:integrase
VICSFPKVRMGGAAISPLNNEALAAFQKLRERNGGEGPMFVDNRGERLLGPRHWFEGAVQEARLNDFTWHDLRHTFASRLVMSGNDLRTVADLLGTGPYR